MAGASDKARFYLEQSIPELHELERKKIFSKEEITSIAKKRSDFEHKINSRGSRPLDYARYAEFEINLESLRRKRVSRIGVKYGSRTGQRRVLFIMDRATRKFHGNISLWIQYVDIARQQKAFKKVSQILTSLVRLHPTKPDIWIYAAKYAFEEHADMTEARSFMQRGLRFCKQSRDLWLAYAELELLYTAKILARRKILGLDQETQGQITDYAHDDPNADVLVLPTITAEDINPELRQDDKLFQSSSQSLNSTPALSGAIPIAIFAAAMDHFKDIEFGAQFFDQVSRIGDIPCYGIVLQQIVDRLHTMDPNSAEYLDAYVRQPLIGVPTMTAEFPRVLGTSLNRLKASMETKTSLSLIHKTVDWIIPYLKAELDVDIRTVLEATLSKMINRYEAVLQAPKDESEEEIAGFIESVQGSGFGNKLGHLLSRALERWPSSARLLKVQEAFHNDAAITQ